MHHMAQASSIIVRYIRCLVSARSGGTRLLVLPGETALPEDGQGSIAGTLCLLDEIIIGGV